jgi:hypothetical protein
MTGLLTSQKGSSKAPEASQWLLETFLCNLLEPSSTPASNSEICEWHNCQCSCTLGCMLV